MPGARYDTSPWIDAVPGKKRPVHPVFRGDEDAPAVIIGGGLTGLMTAYAAAAAGLKVVLLEADRIGQAGSGYGSGICAGEASSSFTDLEAAAGRRVARAQFDHVKRAVLDLAAATRRLRLKGSVNPLEAVRLVAPGASTKGLLRETTARHDAGADATWLKPPAVRKAVGTDGEGAVRLPGWAVCDPYQLALGFARAAESRGARIFEKTTVSKVLFDRTRATVVTPHGRIVTPHVVHATGEPTSLVAALKRHFRWQLRSLVLTDVLPVEVRKAVGPRDRVVYDTETPPHTIRWTGDHRVLVSGAEGPLPRPAQAAKLSVQRTGQLMYELTRLYPDISGVMPAYGWSLRLAHGVDGGMFVGPHRNFPHQLFAFGTAHDPARALLSSRIVLRHLLGTATKEDDLFGFARVL